MKSSRPMQLLCVAITFLLFCAGNVSAKTPLPEFFGVYGLYNGKLIELQAHPRGQYAISGITVMGADVIPQLSGITFPEGKIEFIVFRDSATSFNKMPLSKIARIDAEANTAWGGDGTKKRLKNKYHLMPEEIYMNVAPLKGMMVRVVPKSTLSQGIWAIKIGSELYDFVVGSEEAADCVIRKVGAAGVQYFPCSKNQKLRKQHKNKYEAVCQLAISIKDPRSRALAIAGIAAELAKAGSKEKSESVFSEAIEIARSIKEEDRAKTWVLADIAAELAKAGSKEKSESVFSEAIKVADSVKDAKDKAWALAGIATGLAKIGKTGNALRIANSINNEALKAIALASIATELAKTGKVENALEMAYSIDRKTWKAEALAGIATELAKAGNKQKSESVFSEAIEVADSVKSTWLKSDALSHIAIGLSKTDRIKNALEIANTIKGGERKVYALSSIATELARKGNTERSEAIFFDAIEIADSLKYEDKARAFAGIATELAKLGKVRKAIEISFSLKYTGYACGFPGLQHVTIELARLKTKDKQEDAEIANSIMTALNR